MDHSYEKDTFTDVGISPGESDNLPTATEVPQEDESGPTNSFENVLPLDKLKKGWFTLSAMVMETAAVAQTKATEAYNSEQFQTMKQRTTEVVVPAWERTVEVATPIWEKTKATASVALETTKEKVAVAAEQIRPTVETVIVCLYSSSLNKQLTLNFISTRYLLRYPLLQQRDGKISRRLQQLQLITPRRQLVSWLTT